MNLFMYSGHCIHDANTDRPISDPILFRVHTIFPRGETQTGAENLGGNLCCLVYAGVFGSIHLLSTKTGIL